MVGAAVAAGDDDPFTGFLLDIVEEVDEDGIDVLFAADNGKSVPGASVAVGKGGGFCGVGKVDNGGIEGAPLAAEEFPGNPGKIGLRFPGVGRAGGMGGGADGEKTVVLIAEDGL